MAQQFNQGPPQQGGVPGPAPIPPFRPRYQPLPPDPPEPPRSTTAKWVAAALLVIALIVLFACKEEIAAAFQSMRSIGPGTREDAVLGMIVIGLLGLVIVAVVRILVANERRKGG